MELHGDVFGYPLAPSPAEVERSTKTIIMYNNYRIALRSRVPRTAIVSYTHPSVHARALTTTGYSPPPNQPQTPRNPKTGGDRNPLYIGGGLTAIGALWYYYFVATDSTRVKRQRPAPGIDEATRSAARDSAQRADAAYQDVKGTAQSKAKAVQEQASAGIEGGKQRYEEGKDQIGHRVSEARNAAGKWFFHPNGRLIELVCFYRETRGRG
jgi:hypothetical protein